MSYETVWSFRTQNYDVELRIYPCEADPADSFTFAEDVESVRNGDVMWFDAQVVVCHNGHVIGSDFLGSCAYRDVDEFVASHRAPDPMQRNCSIMRNIRGGNVVICEYFASMVREAIEDARRTCED